ncbi:hypothetical protein [Runella salmonicolor]|uniref:Response regulatory domain-containing protein n=1 Tax=Runella salmonicolor TaxID=2950278 RepID=A0ABT1FVZ5_9BACT|nr:hypothetical protein [Runella salmonicolor]MCP1384843.1 hypothetical protein [Runella salmonicolor]
MMNIKTLLLQDSPSCMHPIDEMIEEPGYEVLRVKASASDELLSYIFTLQPDLIICEASYSKLILKAEQRIKKKIPIVFISTAETEAVKVPPLNRPTAYLTQPFTSGVLLATIQLLL